MMGGFKRKAAAFAAVVLSTSALAGCVTSGMPSQTANAQADQSRYQPVVYRNQAVRGVPLIVLPGQMKSAAATFAQKVGPNNIADWAELELGRAGFPVLERNNLGPMIQEIELAYNLGDASRAKKLFQLGKFKTTKYIAKFDILRAEPVAQAQSGFDGRAIGGLIGALGNSRGADIADGVIGTVHQGEAAQVWLVGLRYTVFDANTTEQVGTGYFEDKMEIGSSHGSFMGVSQGQSGGQTLDGMTQRLVQMAVAEIDGRYKSAPQAPAYAPPPAPASKNR